jgi:hypothetical protein
VPPLPAEGAASGARRRDGIAGGEGLAPFSTSARRSGPIRPSMPRLYLWVLYAAMVVRYWGAGEEQPADFASWSREPERASAPAGWLRP